MAKTPKPAAAKAPEAEPEELRTDGPTEAEYRAAGYKGPYPPRGYAATDVSSRPVEEAPAPAPKRVLRIGLPGHRFGFR